MSLNVGSSNIPDFNQYIKGSKVKEESKENFTKAVFELQDTILNSSDSRQISNFKVVLEDLKGKVCKEGSEVKTLISIVANVANIHLCHTTTISLEGIDPNITGPLSTIIELTQDGHVPEYSLKELYDGIKIIPEQQLSEFIEISEKLIGALKDEGEVKELITACSGDPSKAKILFIIVDFLCLYDFQSKNLEPFNRIFPNIPLDQAPEKIKSLDIVNTKNLTPAQFNNIPASTKALIEYLDLSSFDDVKNIDFSQLTNLKRLTGVKGLIADQFNAIPQTAKASIENLGLSDFNAEGFDFSECSGLTNLSLEGCRRLSNVQIDSIPNKASIQSLSLAGPKTVLSLSGADSIGSKLDLSKFTGINSLNLSYNREAIALFDSIPLETRNSIETLNLSGVIILDGVKTASFNFREAMGNLKVLTLDEAEAMTFMHFNFMPQETKDSIVEVSLEGINQSEYSKPMQIGIDGFMFEEFAAFQNQENEI
jgi:hypothetical protein